MTIFTHVWISGYETHKFSVGLRWSTGPPGNGASHLEFEVGDHVFLKVMPKRGVVEFGKRGKLSSRYIEPFEILERVGIVAYQLSLPPSLFSVLKVFHVSMLQKYTPDPTHVVD